MEHMGGMDDLDDMDDMDRMDDDYWINIVIVRSKPSSYQKVRMRNIPQKRTLVWWMHGSF